MYVCVCTMHRYACICTCVSVGAACICVGGLLQERLRAVVRMYEGTHNFRNFTKKSKARDLSSSSSSAAAYKRHIHSVSVSQVCLFFFLL